jgi:hypothetical protein
MTAENIQREQRRRQQEQERSGEMDLSPSGIDIGHKGRPPPTDFDAPTKNMLNIVRTASAMEDSTERAIKDIEALRRNTLNLAEEERKRRAGA